MTTPTDISHIIRTSAEYLYYHRRQLFVLVVDEQLCQTPYVESLADDLATLLLLEVRMILLPAFATHDKQPDEAAIATLRSRFHEFQDTLTAALASRAKVRQDTVRVISGDWVRARPAGSHSNLGNTGLLGRVHSLDGAEIVRTSEAALLLQSPLACSSAGQYYQLSIRDLCVEVAMQVGANKVIGLCSDWPTATSGTQKTTMEISEARQAFGDTPVTDASIWAAREGVQRVHLLPGKQAGVLLQELYSREGAGVMLVDSEWERIRSATPDDAPALLELLRPLERNGTLVRRSRARFEAELPRFLVMERDRRLIGCCALIPITSADSTAEFAALVVDKEYRSQKRAERLLEAAQEQARGLGIRHLFCLTTKSEAWFIKQGFVRASAEDLPEQRAALYNYERSSTVLRKELS